MYPLFFFCEKPGVMSYHLKKKTQWSCAAQINIWFLNFLVPTCMMCAEVVLYISKQNMTTKIIILKNTKPMTTTQNKVKKK